MEGWDDGCSEGCFGDWGCCSSLIMKGSGLKAVGLLGQGNENWPDMGKTWNEARKVPDDRVPIRDNRRV